MKILCLIDGLTLGGAERQMIGLAYLLRQKGYETDLASYIENDFYAPLLNKLDINVIHLHPSSNKLGKILAVKNLIKEKRYDYVIAYKKGAASIACIIKLMGFKYSLIVSERNTTQKLTFKERIKFFLYRKANYIVPNSYSQERFIKNNYPSLGKRTITISNFTDTNYFVPSTNTPNGKITILTTARIAKQKNVLAYIEAIRRVISTGIDLSVHWFGDVQDGQSDYWEQCKSAINEKKLQESFLFFPASNEILKEYQQCDIYCLPSIYEGYPNVVCEAMSCGKPILCGNICDNPIIVENGENGLLFDPRNIDDMTEKIVMLCKMQRDERLAMGAKSRELAEKKFSENVFVEKYIKLIES